MKLSDLRDNPGSSPGKKRLGRGIGSGKGKTSGRGVKGQKARTGIQIKGFEGGQMPLHRRLPKRGFVPPFQRDLNEVNLDRIQAALETGSLKPGTTITVATLVEAGICSRLRDGVKILGRGELKAKLSFEVDGVSASARAAIEKAGGSIKLLGEIAAAAASA
jgi:large subunit ribosomal protein L15